jgi:hypothetical protein
MLPTHGRLAWPGPHDLDAQRFELYRTIVEGPRAQNAASLASTDGEGRLAGPFNAMLVSAGVGAATHDLDAAVRFERHLSDRQREIAVLELAGLERCEFEWHAHERLGILYGLSVVEIEALRTGAECPSFSAEEDLVRRLVRELNGHRDLDDGNFTTAVDGLGFEGLADLVVLVGYYELIALSLKVWRTPLPEGVAKPW